MIKWVIIILFILAAAMMVYFVIDPYRAIEWWNPLIVKYGKSRDINHVMRELWENKELILREYDSHRSMLMPTANINKYERLLAGDDEKWKMIPIRYLRHWKNREAFPHTTRLLETYDSYLGNAYISVMEGNKNIPTHRGPYANVQRVHIPLRVPRGDLGLETPHGIFRWDRPFFFNDYEAHRAWNNTNEERVVLIFDVFKQLPLPLHVAEWLFIRMSTLYAKRL